MTGASFSFVVSAVVALAAATAAMVFRDPPRSVAGFAVAFAATSVPCIQLGATAVAGALLACAAVIVVLLLGVRASAGPSEARPPRLPLGFWLPALVGVAGFVWVLLATGSRQFVDEMPSAGPGTGAETTMLLVSREFVVPAMLVALLALCAVIAAVLSLVALPPNRTQPTSTEPARS
jgi:NADH:ubiquinone oxidoreductase subunit 6 (subunit J)